MPLLIGHFHSSMQACPSRTGHPILINSLYNFLLCIIKAECLPLRQVFELASPFSSLNQQAVVTANGDGGGTSQQKRLPSLTPEDVAWATAPAVQGPPVVATAVYCLYSIYYAQPGPIITKIRIPREQQATITYLATYLAQSNALDALSQLAQLLKEKALLPGSALQPDTSLTNVNLSIATPAAPDGTAGVSNLGEPPASSLAPGIGASYIIPGLRGEDAATLREVHFHLDSTLTGLGTAHLEPLCQGYGEKLKELWSALGQHSSVAAAGSSKIAARGVDTYEKQEEQQLEGIADLSLGKYLHEYATKKREELQLILQHGPNWREKIMKKEKEAAERATPAGITPIAQEGVTPPSTAIRKKAPPRSRKKAQKKGLSAAAAATAAAAQTIPGVPGNVSRQLLAREKARHVDMARRSQPWAELMGIDNVIDQEQKLHGTTTVTPAVAGYSTGIGLGIDSDEDMPFVPGLQSEFEYLAGPSDVAGGTGTEGGGGGGSTKMTNTTIQGKRGKRTRNKSRDTSDDESMSTSTSSSSMDSSSSEDSDLSDGEEVEMIDPARNEQRRGGGRGGKAAAASRGRGKGRGEKAMALSASAVSGGLGMRERKEGRGGAKKAAGETAAGGDIKTQGDLQNILSEIDMVLKEDARIQF